MLRFTINPQQRERLRWILICVVFPLVVILATIGFFAYTPWRLEKLTREGRAALQRGDYRDASLKARRALQIKPDDLPACTLFAEVCEILRDNQAVSLRERVAELSGGTPDSLITCASTAVTFGRTAVAARALARVPEAHRTRADYLTAAGAVAINGGDLAEAERCFSQAARLEPNKVAHRFSLGMAQIGSDDYLTREAGRRRLHEVAGDKQFAVIALRALIKSYEATGEQQAALRASEKLVAAPDRVFSDELLRLRLLHATGDEGFSSALVLVQENAAKNPRDAGALLVWLSNEQLAREAIDWVVNRAPHVKRMAGIHPALACCYLALEEWDALLAVTDRGAWQTVEYVRNAYRARALREQGHYSFARTEWKLALLAAGRRPDALTWLASTALAWKWADEAEQVLWTALEHTPGTPWVIEFLKRHYLSENDTAGLRRIAAHLVKANPENDAAQNDLAMASLLLNTEADTALRIARRLHEKYPGNAAYISTYAFALYCANRPAEALRLFESLPAARLNEPAFAAYYGIVLAANNEHEKAQEYLEIGQQAPLLPEERALLAKATDASLPTVTAEP